MMKLLVLCLIATLWLQFPSGGDAVCCRKHKFSVRAPDGVWHKGNVCDDCSPGTPYCSYQGCNIFGCNCDGGCRRGMCEGDTFAHQIRNIPSENAHDVIRAADQDGDGMMSIEEAHAYVVREAVPTNQVKRTMRKHAHMAKEALPANHEKRTMEADTHVAKEALPANDEKRTMRKHAHVDKEALPANQVKRTMEARAHVAKEALPANHEKRTMEVDAHVAKEALPANHEKRMMRKRAHVAKEALPANREKRSFGGIGPYKNLKRSLEAMDIDKDNFLSAREIDSNTE